MMDPNTGEFHELKPARTTPEKISNNPNVQARGEVIKRHLDRQIVENYGVMPKKPRRLHPRDVSLVVAATGKPPPPDWPIFAVGEEYEICGQKMTIEKITNKDIWMRGPNDSVSKNDHCELQDREFYVRFTRHNPDMTIVRPTIGRVVRC